MINKNFNYLFSTRCIYGCFVILLLLLSACSKDPVAIDSRKYEGTWKPLEFSDWTGMHNAPPFITTPGKTFYLNGDKISVTEVIMHSDTLGNLSTTSTTSTFNFKYNIQSKLIEEGSSVLKVTEHYHGYTDLGTEALHLEYERVIDLTSKLENYSYSNYKFDITENTIDVNYYTWGGYEANIQRRKLVKIQ